MPATDAHLALAQSLERAFEAWSEDPGPWSDERFEAFALEAFALQFETNLPYGRYCRAVGRNPTTVRSWGEIPPAPSAAFRTVDLMVGDTAEAALRFRTSGTTGGRSSRGVHWIRRPATYRAALRGPFRHQVLAGQDAARILLIHEPFPSRGESSLAWMLDDVLSSFGAPGSERLDPSSGLSAAVVVRALEAAAAGRLPVAILGTTLALAELADLLARTDAEIPLPASSCVMDTGGAKGRPGLDRRLVMSRLLQRFALPGEAAVNEFGMTELLSQRYGRGLAEPWLTGPPWLRTRVVDPVSLAPLPDGEDGLLCHYDLANVGSVVAVLTEDRGRARGDTIQWLGRTPGAMPRGCSLATAELLEAQR